MKRLVKICGLTHISSVDAAVAAGADAVGFVFSDSARKVTARHAAFIANRVPRNVLRVAVMRHPTVELWREVETIFCPDVLQTDVNDFDYLEVSSDIVRWPVVREGTVPPEDVLQGVFVYEGASSGRGEQVDWQVAAEIAKKGRMILAGGLDANNVGAAIREVSPYGVDVSSAVESAPGVKDADLIHAFVAAVLATEEPGGEHASLRSIVEEAVEEAAKDRLQ
jgi:phosphoribosylanthranilate isomerase